MPQMRTFTVKRIQEVSMEIRGVSAQEALEDAVAFLDSGVIPSRNFPVSHSTPKVKLVELSVKEH